MKIRLGVLVLLLLVAGGCTSAGTSASADTVDAEQIDALAIRGGGEPTLVVRTPTNGATVSSPVKLEIDVNNYSLAPSGVSRDGEGHLHIIVGPCIAPGGVMGEDHVHVSDGSAVAELELDPGLHQVCVQMADGFHSALSISQSLEITVAE